MADTSLNCNSSTVSDAPFISFLDPRKLCVTCGANVCSCIDLSGLFIPVTEWSNIIFTMEPDEIKKLDISNIGTTGPRHEIQDVDVSPLFASPSPDRVELNVNNDTVDETITINCCSTFSGFLSSLNAAIKANETLYALITATSTVENFATFTGITPGDWFYYDFTSYVGSPGTIISNPEDFSTTETQTAQRYNSERVKFILLQMIYDETQPSGDKYIEYFHNDDAYNYRPLGKILMLSGCDDVEDADLNLIETVHLRNPQTYNVKIIGLIAI